jgi:hypothetical protein
MGFERSLIGRARRAYANYTLARKIAAVSAQSFPPPTEQDMLDEAVNTVAAGVIARRHIEEKWPWLDIDEEVEIRLALAERERFFDSVMWDVAFLPSTEDD